MHLSETLTLTLAGLLAVSVLAMAQEPLSEPYVAIQADHLGRVTITIDDRDGTVSNAETRVEIRLMDANGNQVADRVGGPDYMSQDWRDRVRVLVDEFRTATGEIHGLDAAPPDDEDEPDEDSI